MKFQLNFEIPTFKVDSLQLIVVAKYYICVVTVHKSDAYMCAIPQLVLAPLKPITNYRTLQEEPPTM